MAVDATSRSCNGADSGPVAHGQARGGPRIVANGLSPVEALRAATVTTRR